MEIRFAGFDRIVAQPNFCDGQPRIAGTRITVGAILTYLAGGMTVEQLLLEFPKLKQEDISQALGFAAANFQDRFMPVEYAVAA